MAFKNGHDDPKVASIEEARKRAAEKARAEKRAAAAIGRGPRTLRDWIVGLLIIAMALGYFASLFVGTPHITREGVQ